MWKFRILFHLSCFNQPKRVDSKISKEKKAKMAKSEDRIIAKENVQNELKSSKTNSFEDLWQQLSIISYYYDGIIEKGVEFFFIKKSWTQN